MWSRCGVKADPSCMRKSVPRSPTVRSSRSVMVRAKDPFPKLSAPTLSPKLLIILPTRCFDQTDEADHALSFLAEHFPDFVYVKTVGNEPWLSLRGVQRAIEVKQLVQQQLVRAGAALENV